MTPSSDRQMGAVSDRKDREMTKSSCHYHGGGHWRWIWVNMEPNSRLVLKAWQCYGVGDSSRKQCPEMGILRCEGQEVSPTVPWGWYKIPLCPSLV